MPIYVYKCGTIRGCGKTFEMVVKYENRISQQCPHCGHVGWRDGEIHQTSDPSFKGSGFYATDYKPKQSGPE
jgi:putative FmdB family regulatory protein